jgi:hypothetical protein
LSIFLDNFLCMEWCSNRNKYMTRLNVIFWCKIVNCVWNGVPKINTEFIYGAMHLYSTICVLWSVSYELCSLGEKTNLPFLVWSTHPIQKKKLFWKIEFSIRMMLLQRIQPLHRFCSYVATLIPLVTNASLCVAL